MPRIAIISVSDKTGIAVFAKSLVELGWEIISTGGTAKHLAENGIKVTPVSDVTKFPEIMDGRVKTLHPAIFAGILADKSNELHLDQLTQLEIASIDLAVVNLYPFEKTIHKENTVEDEAIENIDIGGPAMLRAAAKNFHSVTVVVDPTDYDTIREAIKKGEVPLETRKMLAAKVFAHTAKYDSVIAAYFSKGKYLGMLLEKISDLRYGENPHQQAAFYRDVIPSVAEGSLSLANAQVLQGKELSFNNIVDADAALSLISEFDEPSAAVIKHTNPCGVAICHPELDEGGITNTFHCAWDADSLSAFGGIVVLNRTCTKEIADALSKVFVEIVLAPDFSPESLELFKSKPNLRLIKQPALTRHPELVSGSRNKQKNLKQVSGGILVQDYDNSDITETDLKIVTKKHPSKEELRDMLFAWKVVKHCKSNAIVLAANGVTVGLGIGQTSRIGSVKLAIRQAHSVRVSRDEPLTKHEKNKQLVCASDAFFPFRDSVDDLAKAGITAIIQPGGSKNDGEVISAANEHSISMAFTGTRVFRH